MLRKLKSYFIFYKICRDYSGSESEVAYIMPRRQGQYVEESEESSSYYSSDDDGVAGALGCCCRLKKFVTF